MHTFWRTVREAGKGKGEGEGDGKGGSINTLVVYRHY
jgi:hypothetical protein